MPSVSRSAKKNQPPLETKVQPAQRRATETYERILAVTAQTLADVGVERLSTNLVCERAGLTPPALYRYFPNKYALLSELGRRLMDRQNEVILRWISLEVLGGPVAELESALQSLILETYGVTRDTVGGLWILRALRAVPALQGVRLESHARVTASQTHLMAQAYPQVPLEQVELIGRISVDMMYAAVELLFDEPLDAVAVAGVVAGMVASYRDRLLAAVPRPKRSR